MNPVRNGPAPATHLDANHVHHVPGKPEGPSASAGISIEYIVNKVKALLAKSFFCFSVFNLFGCFAQPAVLFVFPRA